MNTNLDLFPEDIRPNIIPSPKGEMYYKCLGCGAEYGIEELLYVCPACNQVLLIHDRNKDRLKDVSGETWQKIFDYRKMLKIPALKGIYRYHEFIGPSIPLESIIYLGEGHTPMVEANAGLQEKTGVKFYYKNDGQNPSASFKDRGMASALSSIKFLIDQGLVSEVISVCASTGDTSASAALYASYLGSQVKSAVLLPHKKVTSAQLAQPLGSGARVFEIPGVFDDCMKVVEHLSSSYPVALLNSKNAWRILGQESYSYEIAQDFDWDMDKKVVMVPIGNAGNISAVMNGFLKFYNTGIIDKLPKIIGVQSEHADPVYKYYLEPDEGKREFKPVQTQPSVAQAAMIGNPVSMPRVIQIAREYDAASGHRNVFVVQVKEQQIMDWQLTANQNGHITCTQGGECLAGMVQAKALNLVNDNETVILDATAHAIKFSGFQDLYFKGELSDAYGISSDSRFINLPDFVSPDDPDLVPSQENPLGSSQFEKFVKDVSKKIATRLGL
ncbi:threonine synthase [uncultured Desulfobacter sp.]|uniref:threonine synthase n=1 Tax=uncultured Desulfobacter sp. TaxID=240139 RepID=UPI0029F4BF94|nr:threonine synthase [uncultured Desulfobacter sp.]